MYCASRREPLLEAMERACVCVCVRERDHHGVTQGGVYGRAEEGRAIERHLFLP